MSATASDWRRASLGGAVLATLSFFPLLDALATTPAWMHWTAFDSLEAAASWTVTATLIALTLLLARHLAGRRGADAIGALWLLTGSMFAIVSIIRLSALDETLRAHRTSAGWVFATLTPLLVTVGAWAVLRPGPHPISRVQRVLTILWPLPLLFAFHLLRAPSLSEHQRAGLSPSPAPTISTPAFPASAPTFTAGAKQRTVVLLFDELSVDYLYGQRAKDLSPWPALARLRTEATLYRDAHLLGGGTQFAIPALFGATTAAPDGLVNALRRQGQSVRIWGWYHDYCQTFARAADECHATSIYNPRTLHNGFSIIDPWWTNIALLPAEVPFEYLKSPAAVAFHRATLTSAREWLAAQMADPRADFIYAHLNVPHLPLINERLGWLAVPTAFKMTEQGYLSQFAAVDAFIAQALADHTRPTRLVVMSDHNARQLLPKAQHDHVVLMSHGPSTRAPDVTAHENAADVIARIGLGLVAP
ncbi:MAG TPA: hypothetical protein VLA61_09220 [Ideonella sp.]|uniref:hypothetical protein n=1 Tax=Ideonella sp. TaxID=1929293 RepID=UPI002B5DF996|nr:hypothetical protein [Ideonella sp.]HSI48436.1 hypothetical protein [Ideonella sp.]